MASLSFFPQSASCIPQVGDRLQENLKLNIPQSRGHAFLPEPATRDPLSEAFAPYTAGNGLGDPGEQIRSKINAGLAKAHFSGESSAARKEKDSWRHDTQQRLEASLARSFFYQLQHATASSTSISRAEEARGSSLASSRGLLGAERELRPPLTGLGAGCRVQKSGGSAPVVEASIEGNGGKIDKKSFLSLRSAAVVFAFGGVAAFLKALLAALPPDFLDRWNKLFDEQPHYDPKARIDVLGGTTLYDCHGTIIATVIPGGFSGRKDPHKPQAPLKPHEIPSAMWQAVVASEDRRFFEHHGFDPRGVSRAILSLARTGGGSTITQQLVKNVFLTNERKWARKIVEIILAVLLEKQMSKWDILHLYLNKIYWGHGVNGIEAASALYFGKHPSLLTLGECAMLAGIIPAPELLSPYRDPSRGKKPQARSLRRMVEAGFLDIGMAQAAAQDPLVLGSEGKEGNSGPWRAPYFVSEVLYELAHKYGREEILRGGLEVHTTLDLPMQDVAERVVKEGSQEYDRERVTNADRGLERARVRLESVWQQRQEQMLAALASAGLRRVADLAEEEGSLSATSTTLMPDPSMAEAASLALQQQQQGGEGGKSLADAVAVAGAGVAAAVAGVASGEGEGQRASALLVSQQQGKGGRLGKGDGDEAAAVRTAVIDSRATAQALDKLTATEKVMRAAITGYEEELRKAVEARLEGAMVATDPTNGAVRVLVGGRDYYESSFNRATQALRPPGSTFKPVVYLAALSEGMEKDHVLVDEPYEVGGFAPENYDRKFRGQVTLEYSLLKSLNVPTVKLCAEIGVDKVCQMGRALGIKTPLPHELALSLGGCEVTPLQLATVYSTIAGGGVYHKPHLITRVEAHDGTVLEEVKQPTPERKTAVVNEYAVSELRQLLQSVVEKGTGKAARLGRPCAGKTGTSDGHRDCWFAGFTPQLSCIVWLGYDDNAPVGGLHPGTGASHAAPLWKRFMATVHEGLPVRKFHDIGRDKHGSRAPILREFEKRSRRAHKHSLRDGWREGASKAGGRTPVAEVWDWEKASSTWEEREKMEEWAAARKQRSEEVRKIRAMWGIRPPPPPGTAARPDDDDMEDTFANGGNGDLNLDLAGSSSEEEWWDAYEDDDSWQDEKGSGGPPAPRRQQQQQQQQQEQESATADEEGVEDASASLAGGVLRWATDASARGESVGAPDDHAGGAEVASKEAEVKTWPWPWLGAGSATNLRERDATSGVDSLSEEASVLAAEFQGGVAIGKLAAAHSEADARQSGHLLPPALDDGSSGSGGNGGGGGSTSERGMGGSGGKKGDAGGDVTLEEGEVAASGAAAYERATCGGVESKSERGSRLADNSSGSNGGGYGEGAGAGASAGASPGRAQNLSLPGPLSPGSGGGGKGKRAQGQGRGEGEGKGETETQQVLLGIAQAFRARGEGVRRGEEGGVLPLQRGGGRRGEGKGSGAVILLEEPDDVEAGEYCEIVRVDDSRAPLHGLHASSLGEGAGVGPGVGAGGLLHDREPLPAGFRQERPQQAARAPPLPGGGSRGWEAGTAARIAGKPGGNRSHSNGDDIGSGGGGAGGGMGSGGYNENIGSPWKNAAGDTGDASPLAQGARYVACVDKSTGRRYARRRAGFGWAEKELLDRGTRLPGGGGGGGGGGEGGWDEEQAFVGGGGDSEEREVGGSSQWLPPPLLPPHSSSSGSGSGSGSIDAAAAIEQPHVQRRHVGTPPGARATPDAQWLLRVHRRGEQGSSKQEDQQQQQQQQGEREAEGPFVEPRVLPTPGQEQRGPPEAPQVSSSSSSSRRAAAERPRSPTRRSMDSLSSDSRAGRRGGAGLSRRPRSPRRRSIDGSKSLVWANLDRAPGGAGAGAGAGGGGGGGTGAGGPQFAIASADTGGGAGRVPLEGAATRAAAPSPHAVLAYMQHGLAGAISAIQKDAPMRIPRKSEIISSRLQEAAATRAPPAHAADVSPAVGSPVGSLQGPVAAAPRADLLTGGSHRQSAAAAPRPLDAELGGGIAVERLARGKARAAPDAGEASSPIAPSPLEAQAREAPPPVKRQARTRGALLEEQLLHSKVSRRSSDLPDIQERGPDRTMERGGGGGATGQEEQGVGPSSSSALTSVLATGNWTGGSSLLGGVLGPRTSWLLRAVSRPFQVAKDQLNYSRESASTSATHVRLKRDGAGSPPEGPNDLLRAYDAPTGAAPAAAAAAGTAAATPAAAAIEEEMVPGGAAARGPLPTLRPIRTVAAPPAAAGNPSSHSPLEGPSSPKSRSKSRGALGDEQEGGDTWRGGAGPVHVGSSRAHAGSLEAHHAHPGSPKSQSSGTSKAFTVLAKPQSEYPKTQRGSSRSPRSPRPPRSPRSLRSTSQITPGSPKKGAGDEGNAPRAAPRGSASNRRVLGPEPLFARAEAPSGAFWNVFRRKRS